MKKLAPSGHGTRGTDAVRGVEKACGYQGALTTIPLNGSPPKASPISGTPSLWFLDGEHFMSSYGGVRWIYAKDGTLTEAIPDNTQISGGTKDYYWSDLGEYSSSCTAPRACCSRRRPYRGSPCRIRA